MSGLRNLVVFINIIKENKIALMGMIIIVIIIFVGIFAPVIATHDPMELNILDRLQPPGKQYILGTDDLGKDIYSQVVWGTRTSLIVSFSVVLLSSLLGITFGLVSGYLHEYIDFTLMRIMDGLMAFPALLLSLAIMAIRGASLTNLILAIAIVFIPTFARLTRNQVLSIKRKEYVESANISGCGSIYIMLRHILPNCLPPIIIQSTIVLGYAILNEAALGFLGLSVPGQVSWGSVLNEGRRFLYDAPWIAFFPGVIISVFVLGVNLTGDGLRDIFDPRMK